jgi:hypothetical protein
MNPARRRDLPMHADQPRRKANIPERGLLDDPRPDTAAPLTKAQRDAIVAWVARAGRDRLITQRSAFSEADFLAGAMVVFYAFGSENQLPASWLFGGPMTGRSCFTTDREPPAFGGEPLCFSCLQGIDDPTHAYVDRQGRRFCDEGCFDIWREAGEPAPEQED